MKREIKVTLSIDDSNYSFTIFRDEHGDLNCDLHPDIPNNVKELFDDLWLGHASSVL